LSSFRKCGALQIRLRRGIFPESDLIKDLKKDHCQNGCTFTEKKLTFKHACSILEKTPLCLLVAHISGYYVNKVSNTLTCES